MTLAAIESFLADRGLRLSKAVRSGRRHFVEARDKAGKATSATGIDLEDAIRNLVAIVDKKPKSMRFS